MGEKRERILRKVHLVLANEGRDDRCRSGFLLFHTLHLAGVLQKLIAQFIAICRRSEIVAMGMRRP